MRVLLVAIFVVCSWPGLCSADRGINGGMDCATCTVLVGLLEQLAVIHNESLADTTSRLCDYLPSSVHVPCQLMVRILEPALFKGLTRKYSADVICYTLEACYVEPNRTSCHLFPEPEGGVMRAVKAAQNSIYQPLPLRRMGSSSIQAIQTYNWCDLPIISSICDILAKPFVYKKPALDFDGDYFSRYPTFRGSSWRGGDCNDFDPNIYPGRQPANWDVYVDSNCNGIHGLNPATGTPFEKELCSDSDPRGIIFIGDSLTAHFHMPEQWFTASLLDVDVLQNITFVLNNEADWPQLSYATGHENTTWPIAGGFTDSIYWRLRQRNLCNHRDYQNIAVNGIDSGGVLTDYVIGSVSRNKSRDYPAIVFYALVGNDVCNRMEDTIPYMTTPEQFHDNVMKSLAVLDQQLPAGSHVILIGLADGGVIYDMMHSRVHPVGRLRGDVTYDDVYDWWKCMEIGPCYGWLTSNSTLRKLTTQRAEDLSKVLKKLSKTAKFSSFDLIYLDNPLKEVQKMWAQLGREPWRSIEPVDSFHPVQATHPLMTEVIWSQLEKNYPYVLGKVNPRNDEIARVFRHQGGH